MKKAMDKIYNLSLHSVQWITLLLTILLFAGSFLLTCYSTNMETQKVLTRWDNPILNILGSGLLCTLLLAAAYAIAQKASKYKVRLLCITWGWMIVLGVILILFSKTVPAADALSVYSAAEALAGGDTSVIHPTDSYLSYYPQQVGLMAFFEVLFRFWNLLGIGMPAYHFIKGIYILILCAAVFFQYKTVHLLWENDTTDCLYLLLAGANFPLIMYSSFVYGEIPTLAAFSAGLYFLLRFLKNSKSLLYGGLSLLLFTFSVMVRKNSLILVIAVLLVLILEGLKNRKSSLLLYALLCAVCAFSILPLVQKGYEMRAGNSLKTGVPAMSYFAMGTQESSRGNGWYNGFNFETYQSTGMDTELTNEISRQALSERLDYFKANPGYAAKFYLGKHLSQWADGTYAVRQATLATFGGRRELFNRLYEGDLSNYYIEYCNLYQNIIYLGALLFCILQCRRRRLQNPEAQKETGPHPAGLPLYIGLIGILGGFLFHIIWEANSRYIFVYGVLLLPYAAKGLSLIVHFALENSKKIIKTTRHMP